MQQNVVQIVTLGGGTGRPEGFEALIFWPVLCVIDHDVAEWKAATTIASDEKLPVKSTQCGFFASSCVQQNVMQEMDDAR